MATFSLFIPQRPFGACAGGGNSSSGVHASMFLDLVPAPDWLNPGHTAWQLTAATLVGLMSVPGLAILYAGLMKRKWALNSALMVLYAFGATLVVWSFWGYKMAFGTQLTDILHFVGIPGSILGPAAEQGQASLPLWPG